MTETWIEKKETERVRVAISEFQERKYIDIRTYYQNQEGEWKPTQKGVTLPPDKLEELKEALNKLEV